MALRNKREKANKEWEELADLFKTVSLREKVRRSDLEGKFVSTVFDYDTITVSIAPRIFSGQFDFFKVWLEKLTEGQKKEVEALKVSSTGYLSKNVPRHKDDRLDTDDIHDLRKDIYKSVLSILREHDYLLVKNEKDDKMVVELSEVLREKKIEVVESK